MLVGTERTIIWDTGCNTTNYQTVCGFQKRSTTVLVRKFQACYRSELLRVYRKCRMFTKGSCVGLLVLIDRKSVVSRSVLLGATLVLKKSSALTQRSSGRFYSFPFVNFLVIFIIFFPHFASCCWLNFSCSVSISLSKFTFFWIFFCFSSFS